MERIKRLPRWVEQIFNTPSHHASTTALATSTSTKTMGGS